MSSGSHRCLPVSALVIAESTFRSRLVRRLRPRLPVLATRSFLLRCPACLRHDPNPSRLRPLALLSWTIIAVFKLIRLLMQFAPNVLQHLGNPPVAGLCGQPKAFLSLGAKLVGKVSHSGIMSAGRQSCRGGMF